MFSGVVYDAFCSAGPVSDVQHEQAAGVDEVLNPVNCDHGKGCSIPLFRSSVFSELGRTLPAVRTAALSFIATD